MKRRTTWQLTALVIMALFSCGLSAEAEDLGVTLKTFLDEYPEFKHQSVGIVVGALDAQGTRVFSFGKIDPDGREPNGDTLFEIGSITKTFTALVLQEMVDDGAVKFDDPVAKYLPGTVKVPAFNGHPITLFHLATQSSGLPFNPDHFSPADENNPFADYSTDRLYAFLSGYSLKEKPGEKFSYSNVGMGLLGHVLSIRAGRDYESLVVERICRPLHMDSTRITLSRELKARMARGHDENGKPAPNFEFQALAGTGALRSTANDLLKYVSAQVGLAQSELTPLMQKTHVIRFRAPAGADEAWRAGNSGMPWVDNGVEQPPGMQLMGHGGGTAGYSAFIGFDVRQRRGVVVLCNQQGGPLHAGSIGWVLLQRRPLTRDAVANVLLHGREIVGIGVSLDLDPATHMPRITKVFPHSPAADAGLSSGQVVQKIDAVRTQGKPLNECASLIRGPEGSTLRLVLIDPDGKTNTVELTRHKVKL